MAGSQVLSGTVTLRTLRNPNLARGRPSLLTCSAGGWSSVPAGVELQSRITAEATARSRNGSHRTGATARSRRSKYRNQGTEPQ